MAEQIGLSDKCYRRACEFLCLVMLATVGEYPGRQSLAEDLCGDVLARSGFLAYRDQAGGFGVPALTLGRDGSGQLGCGAGQVAPFAHLVEGVVFAAKVTLGGRRIAG